MGLDLVELVMEVEERFGITISDHDAEKIQTVGQLHAYILTKLDRVQTSIDQPCLSASVFYRFRRALVDQFGISRRSVSPESSLDSLIPLENRRTLWSQLAASLDLALPRLARPGWAERVVISMGIAGVVLWSVPILAIHFATRFAAGMVLVLGAWVLWHAVQPLAVRVPKACTTVRGTVTSIVGLNLDTLCNSRQSWTRNSVWDVLVAIIVERLGVRPEEVTPSASFVNDLGCD